jgi:histone acetyltransferase
MGFSEQEQLAREVWQGYVKDYEGGTFMQAKVDKRLDYRQLDKIVKE